MIHPTFDRLSKEKQERILSAGKQEFLAFPYEKSSINRILEQAGVPKGSFYQYFDTKEDIFYLCIKSVAVKLTTARQAQHQTLLDAGLKKIHAQGYETGTQTYMQGVKNILTQDELDLYQRLIDAPANVRNHLLMEIAAEIVAPLIKEELEQDFQLPEDTDLVYLAYLLSMSEVLAMDYGIRVGEDSIGMLKRSYTYMDALLKGVKFVDRNDSF